MKKKILTLFVCVFVIGFPLTTQAYNLKWAALSYGIGVSSSSNYIAKLSANTCSQNLENSDYKLIVGVWHPPYTRMFKLEESAQTKPVQFNLTQNYPNPFNRTTKFRYSLPVPSKVKISVYDIAGRVVEVLVNGQQEAGFHEVEWNIEKFSPNELPNGIYFYRLETPNYVATKKMVIVR